MLWFHLTVLSPHLRPPCHVATAQRKKREIGGKESKEGRGKRDERKKERERARARDEVIVADLGWTEDMSPLFASPRENILTK